MAQVFSHLMLEKLAPPKTGRVEVWDARIPGFGLRVSASGTKTFVLVYRHRGRPRRLSLGRFPYVSLSAARDKANSALKQVMAGEDPALAGVERKDTSYQFDEVLNDFVARYIKLNNKLSTQKEHERVLRRQFGLWGKRDIRDITQKHVAEVIDRLVEAETPSAANHALAVVRKFFNWCVERELLTVNPCGKLKKPSPDASRERTLTTEELVAVWHAFDADGYPFGAMGKLLILTGQRRGEVVQIDNRQVDLTAKIWTIPAEVSKNKKPHPVPLSDAALEVLAGIRLRESGHYFQSRANDETTVSGFSRAKKRIDDVSGVTGWTYHDLRRTVATKMAELGIAPHVIERVLNHVSGTFGGVAGIYNRFQYQAEMREALERWATYVEGLTLKTKARAI